MKYGLMNITGYTTVITNTNNLNAVTPLVKWCDEYMSDGKFHYQFTFNEQNQTVWKFERKEDALIFALTFGEHRA